ncbi:MAG: hypothetical protein QF570_05570 [Myxococcota bacterium]|jgi:hypothetical protein|nr:hypothetical protein [Myxococcota bacterium]
MRLINGLRDWLSQQRQLAAQRRELASMREELAGHRERHEKMLAGMQRCMGCEYRSTALQLRAERKTDA